MTLIYVYQHRGISRDIAIKDADGNAITPGANDRVRVIIGREDEISAVGEVVTGAELVVVSGSPTTNGSSITKGALNRMRLDAADLDFDAGVYSLWVEYYDNADAQEWKCVERQVIHLEHT